MGFRQLAEIKMPTAYGCFVFATVFAPIWAWIEIARRQYGLFEYLALVTVYLVAVHVAYWALTALIYVLLSHFPCTRSFAAVFRTRSRKLFA